MNKTVNMHFLSLCRKCAGGVSRSTRVSMLCSPVAVFGVGVEETCIN